ncbi:hypothetical protein BGZ60DRAFT_420118 [Tricladium varicosporioides]|nr:hypothetical protein BGZ60DRAFT_420118 [Hymenoscyphus varicosporioides]
MATRKRKNDEELVALPSDESEEEEEYVLSLMSVLAKRITALPQPPRTSLNWLAQSFKVKFPLSSYFLYLRCRIALSFALHKYRS